MITKDNNLKVMNLFFRHPETAFHIRELSRLTKLSSTGVIKIVKKLKKEGLLISVKERNLELVKANFDGRFPFVKRVYNIYSLHDCGLVDYLRKAYEEPKSIVLFGSYSNGTDVDRSDIDIAIIGALKKPKLSLKNFEKKLERKIEIHEIEIGKSDKNFKNSLGNGIVLGGFLEII